MFRLVTVFLAAIMKEIRFYLGRMGHELVVSVSYLVVGQRATRS